MLGEILGFGANLIGGLMGASAEKKAAKENRAIAEMNLAWEKERWNKMIEIALRQEKEGKLGYRDADGNWVHYVEGEGWKVDLSPESLLRQEYQRDEERNQFQQDLPAKREQMFRNIAQQRGESDYADAIRSGMMNIREQPSEDAAAIQNLIGAEGINEGYDATQENALRAAFRAGGGMGDVAAKVGAARSNDLRKLFAGNNQAAKDEAYNRYSTRVGNEANKYNMFAARGSAMPAVQYNPKDIGGETGNLLSRAAGAGANAAGAALNAYAQPGPQLKYEAPVNYGMAKTLMTAGSDLSNMFGGMNFNFGGNYGSSNSYGYPAAPSGKYQEGKGLW